MTSKTSTGARTRSRELVLQALYQQQIAGHEIGELLEQFREQTAYQRVDQEHFDGMLREIIKLQEDLDKAIEDVIDRPLDQLDPVERAVLLIGVFELKERIDVPYRVVINEGVNLAKRFGAIDGHKYINGCLDNAAKSYRQFEINAGM